MELDEKDSADVFTEIVDNKKIRIDWFVELFCKPQKITCKSSCSVC